jgi:hypothetical protein
MKPLTFRWLPAHQIWSSLLVPSLGKPFHGLEKDFFRNPLPEAERRRDLAQCPRNMERDYQQPVLNQLSVCQSAKRTDAQLADIQFRWSGITRPMDHLLHQSIAKGPPTLEDVVEFVNTIHELLYDTASHITQLTC